MGLQRCRCALVNAALCYVAALAGYRHIALLTLPLHASPFNPQAQDALCQAHAELEALTATAEQLAEQQQHSAAAAEELGQQLADAEQRLAASQSEEQRLTVRCTELEAQLLEQESAAEADAAAARAAREQHAEAAAQAASLQQQLGIAQAQVCGWGVVAWWGLASRVQFEVF